MKSRLIFSFQGKLGVDIGERTREMFADTISRAETIVWSGLPGAWEFDSFSEGSKAMADAIVEVKLHISKCFFFFITFD